MNNNWQQYLQDNAVLDSDAATDNKKADNVDIICELSPFSVLVVAGDDAAGFMQGQFTNDV